MLSCVAFYATSAERNIAYRDLMEAVHKKIRFIGFTPSSQLDAENRPYTGTKDDDHFLIFSLSHAQRKPYGGGVPHALEYFIVEMSTALVWDFMQRSGRDLLRERHIAVTAACMPPARLQASA